MGMWGAGRRAYTTTAASESTTQHLGPRLGPPLVSGLELRITPKARLWQSSITSTFYRSYTNNEKKQTLTFDLPLSRFLFFLLHSNISNAQQSVYVVTALKYLGQ